MQKYFFNFSDFLSVEEATHWMDLIIDKDSKLMHSLIGK